MRGKLTGERPAFIGPPPARSLAPWRYAPSHTMVLRLTRQDSGLHVHARLSPTSPALHLQRIQTRRESIIGSAAHWRCRPSLEVPPIGGAAYHRKCRPSFTNKPRPAPARPAPRRTFARPLHLHHGPTAVLVAACHGHHRDRAGRVLPSAGHVPTIQRAGHVPTVQRAGHVPPPCGTAKGRW